MTAHPTYEDLENIAKTVKIAAHDSFVNRQVLVQLLGEVASTKDDPQGFILRITEAVQATFDRHQDKVEEDDSRRIANNLESMRIQALRSQGL